jgi:hypothetical protein
MRRMFVAGTAFVGTILFVYSIHALGMAQIQEALVRIGWGFGAILALSGAREVARTLAWMRTIEGPFRLSFTDAFRARLAGEALNTLLPMGMLVGEPAKAEHVRHRLPFATAFAALVVELAFYGSSLVLLFSAGAVALVPSSAVLFLFMAGIAAIAVLRFRNGSRGAMLADPAAISEVPISNTVKRVVKKLRGFSDPVIGFSSRHPDRVWSIVAFETAFQVFAVAEVYLTLALITPGHAGWKSAVVLETVGRAVTMMFKMLPMRMGVDEAGAALFADRLGLGASTGIMLALVRKMRLLAWSAVGLAFLVRRSTGVVAAPAAPATDARLFHST